MNKERVRKDEFQRILIEHRQLHALAQRACDLLGERRESGFVIRGLLDELYERLECHFAHEEFNGYFEETIAIAPRLKPQLEALEAQHPIFLQTIQRIRDRVDADEISEATWTEINEMFAHFMRDFFEHESQENLLVQEAYLRDEAEGD